MPIPRRYGQPLQLYLQSQSLDQTGPVAVIARICDVLNVDRTIDAAPEMGIIVPFEDVFPHTPEVSVAQEKAQTAKIQTFLVVAEPGSK